MKLKKLFIGLLIVNTIALFFVIFIIGEYQKSNRQLELAYQMQHRSLVLADELRQSSDDLTRMARTYVLTGNEMFKKQFQMVLDIRNGKLPRPKNYNQIYWDFLTMDGSEPILDGKQIPLKELMKQAGFPDEELALLLLSQKESDDLTYLETKAMNAMIGIFQDKDGNYTIKDEPNYKLAREIMHSDEYHKAKIAIMKPLDQFYQAFEQRTKQKIVEANSIVERFESYMGWAILAFLILIFFSFFIILLRIIHPLEILNKTMLLLSSNKMDTVIPEHSHNDEVGEMIGSVEIFKQNAIKLISSEQQNKLLLDLAGEGIFGLDAKGRFSFLNPMTSMLLGFESDELIGKELIGTIYKPNEKVKKKERLLLASHKEVLFYKKDGSTFPIDYVATPIYNDKELVIGSVVVFSDITERKENEDRLKSAIDEAKRANHSKTVFLTNMSHELRTPLNAILGFASLLENSNNLNQKEKENILTIRNSGRHLMDMINEILELSKIEAGKIEIQPVHFDLFELCEQIKQMFISRCEEKALEFSIDIKSSVPQYIYCDQHRLRQILINLLGNALKFTYKGNISVEVNADKGLLYFKVIDTGIGISKENQNKIFKPFEQINNPLDQNGTGLGLAITKELIMNMDGDIEVQSQMNKGSEFSFYIIYEDSSIDQIVQQKAPIPINTATENYNNIQVLVVDDIEENRSLIIQMLHTYNIKTVEANDGIQAVQIANEQKIDLCFMDLRMKQMNGIEAIGHIRQDGHEFPIIVVSANAFEKDKEDAIKAGANGFLAKPIEQHQLISMMNLFLNMSANEEDSLEESELQETELSEELLHKIKSAAQELDSQSIDEVIQDLPNNAKFKIELQNYLSNYDFESIINIINKKL